jgi:hypothetical protein
MKLDEPSRRIVVEPLEAPAPPAREPERPPASEPRPGHEPAPPTPVP